MENSQCVCPSVAWIEYIKAASGFFICLTVLFLFFYLKRIWQKATEFFYNVSDTGVPTNITTCFFRILKDV